MMNEKIKTEVSVNMLIEATNKCIDAIGKGYNLDKLTSMDQDTFLMVQTSLQWVKALNEATLQQARAIDQLTNMIYDMNDGIKQIDTRFDRLDKKSSNEKA